MLRISILFLDPGEDARAVLARCGKDADSPDEYCIPLFVGRDAIAKHENHEPYPQDSGATFLRYEVGADGSFNCIGSDGYAQVPVILAEQP